MFLKSVQESLRSWEGQNYDIILEFLIRKILMDMLLREVISL